MAIRKKIVKLAKLAGGTAGMLNKIDETRPSTTLWRAASQMRKRTSLCF